MDEPPRPTEAAAAPDPLAAHHHLRQVAIAELVEVRAILASTGHDLETSRARISALLVDLEDVRAELSERDEELGDTLATLESTTAELSRCRADADRVAQENAATTQAQQDHIARLKTQIQSPWRLVAKWCLRRGPYSRAARSR